MLRMGLKGFFWELVTLIYGYLTYAYNREISLHKAPAILGLYKHCIMPLHVIQ